MNPSARCRFAIAASLLAIVLALPSATAQQSTVSGLVINFGVVSAAEALRAEGHRESHPENPPPGSQHLLITLDDEKSGKRIGDAEVVAEVTDPKGHVERKPLLHTKGGGLPDYSELFVFDWSGDYSIRVMVTLFSGAKPVEARFTIKHAV